MSDDEAEKPTPFRSVLLKVSGECFSGEGLKGFDQDHLAFLTGELAQASINCRSIAVVMGAGNLVRGRDIRPAIGKRLQGDHAGMLATAVNALVLQGALINSGVRVEIRSAVPLGSLILPFRAEEGREILSDGRILLLCCGTGNPFFTTDTAAALRACELGVDALLKATKVDGLYSADPKKDPNAQHFRTITYDEVVSRRLGAMDLESVLLCRAQQIPIVVFEYDVSGNIARAVRGEHIGTRVGSGG
ncbi:MAG TPA: uridine monophosphate kinase [Candidatus Brocadiia bacterium]|nr:uridine monophosphate kinase [Candidatus Brocadiia bacterium]